MFQYWTVRACLIDVYDTILSVDFTAHEREMPALAGLSLDAWLRGIVRIGASLNIGQLTKAEGFGLVMRAGGVEPRPDVVRALVDKDRELMLRSARLYDDSIPFLEELRSRGVKIAIVSNCSESTRELLVKTGVAALADALVLSYEVGMAKPSPRIFRHALEQLGASADEALFIDDQPVFCAGALALGIDAVQIARDEIRGGVPGAGIRVVRSLREVEPSEPLLERRAGRVIVLDPEDRVLLFRYDDGAPNGRHWSTPGGGLNDGEDYAAGARRELAEETGWTDVTLGPEVHKRTLTMEYADRIVRQYERFFLARVQVAQREFGDMAAMHISDGIAAWRWWSLEEMDATDEVIWPSGLADLVRGLSS
jgi:putative hydrolase of the HAD superfamily